MSRIDFTPALTSVIGRGRERAEVGGLVEGLARAPVHAAEAARRHDPDARAMREPRGARRRWCPRRGPARGRSAGRARSPSPRARRCRAARSRPARADDRTPSITPIVAGTTPASRTNCSDARPTSRLRGRRQPVAQDRGLEGEHGRTGVDRAAHLLGDTDDRWAASRHRRSSRRRMPRRPCRSRTNARARSRSLAMVVGPPGYRGDLCRNQSSSPRTS